MTRSTYWLYLSNFAIAHVGKPRHGILDVTWSLAIEEQFYLIWPAVVAISSRRSLMRIALALAATSLVFRIALHLYSGYNTFSIYVLTPCRFDGLAVGAMLAAWAREPGGLVRLLRPANAIAIGTFPLIIGIPVAEELLVSKEVGAGVGLDPVFNVVGFTLLAAFFGSLLVLTLMARPRTILHRFFSSSFLRTLGKYSYGLYLIHLPLRALIRDRVFRSLNARPLDPFSKNWRLGAGRTIDVHHDCRGRRTVCGLGIVSAVREAVLEVETVLSVEWLLSFTAVVGARVNLNAAPTLMWLSCPNETPESLGQAVASCASTIFADMDQVSHPRPVTPPPCTRPPVWCAPLATPSRRRRSSWSPQQRSPTASALFQPVGTVSTNTRTSSSECPLSALSARVVFVLPQRSWCPACASHLSGRLLPSQKNLRSVPCSHLHRPSRYKELFRRCHRRSPIRSLGYPICPIRYRGQWHARLHGQVASRPKTTTSRRNDIPRRQHGHRPRPHPRPNCPQGFYPH